MLLGFKSTFRLKKLQRIIIIVRKDYRHDKIMRGIVDADSACGKVVEIFRCEEASQAARESHLY